MPSLINHHQPWSVCGSSGVHVSISVQSMILLRLFGWLESSSVHLCMPEYSTRLTDSSPAIHCTLIDMRDVLWPQLLLLPYVFPSQLFVDIFVSSPVEKHTMQKTYYSCNYEACLLSVSDVNFFPLAEKHLLIAVDDHIPLDLAIFTSRLQQLPC